MTELTEQEKLALNRAWCNYDKEYPEISEMDAMMAGFEAGLSYQRLIPAQPPEVDAYQSKMNSDQWKIWADIVSCCEAHQRNINVGTKQRREAVTAIDAEIRQLREAFRAFISGAITQAELEAIVGEIVESENKGNA